MKSGPHPQGAFPAPVRPAQQLWTTRDVPSVCGKRGRPGHCKVRQPVTLSGYCRPRARRYSRGDSSVESGPEGAPDPSREGGSGEPHRLGEAGLASKEGEEVPEEQSDARPAQGWRQQYARRGEEGEGVVLGKARRAGQVQGHPGQPEDEAPAGAPDAQGLRLVSAPRARWRVVGDVPPGVASRSRQAMSSRRRIACCCVARLPPSSAVLSREVRRTPASWRRAAPAMTVLPREWRCVAASCPSTAAAMPTCRDGRRKKAPNTAASRAQALGVR